MSCFYDNEIYPDCESFIMGSVNTCVYLQQEPTRNDPSFVTNVRREKKEEETNLAAPFYTLTRVFRLLSWEAT